VNKVSSLISEAIEAIVERLNTKDKLTAANKAMIRNMDTKQKHMETSINQLLKLNKQVNDHHTKIRSLQAECELQAAARVQDATNKELEDLKLANSLETIEQ
jgi:hypothetical protein